MLRKNKQLFSNAEPCFPVLKNHLPYVKSMFFFLTFFLKDIKTVQSADLRTNVRQQWRFSDFFWVECLALVSLISFCMISPIKESKQHYWSIGLCLFSHLPLSLICRGKIHSRAQKTEQSSLTVTQPINKMWKLACVPVLPK